MSIGSSSKFIGETIRQDKQSKFDIDYTKYIDRSVYEDIKVPKITLLW